MHGMKDEFVKVVGKKLKPTLSGRDYCPHCRKAALSIEKALSRGIKVEMRLVPEYNISGVVTKFHIEHLNPPKNERAH